MRKMKKLAALFLAALMAISCMVMPAMAAADDGIMPIPAARMCSNCADGVVSMWTATRYMRMETTCKDCSFRHYHKIPYTVDIEDCDSCTYYWERNNNDHQFPGICLHE